MGLAEVDVLITLGRIEVRRAVDVFGESAFPSFGIFSLFDTVTGGTPAVHFNPLIGRYRWFTPNNYYFFAVLGSEEIAISGFQGMMERMERMGVR